jgi:glutathione S-transferase
MSLLLYAHPFSSYCQKVLTALYENGTPFTVRTLDGGEAVSREFAELWPIKRMPLLVDDGQTVVESSVIIEHLGLKHPGPVALIPPGPQAALDVRFMDRFFDNYVMTPMQRIVADYLRPADQGRDPFIVAESKAMLDKAYAWLEARLAALPEGSEWVCPAHGFTLADCSAAPSLFYADWVHEIGPAHAHLRAYRQRLLARRSFARAVDEARPFRAYFPPGAPDRD